LEVLHYLSFLWTGQAISLLVFLNTIGLVGFQVCWVLLLKIGVMGIVLPVFTKAGLEGNIFYQHAFLWTGQATYFTVFINSRIGR
jgi:hypothetical protein